MSARQRLKWLARGIAAASFVVIVQLISLQTLQLSHHVAIVCFSGCLPWSLIAGIWPIEEQSATIRAKNIDFWTIILTPICTLTFLAGVGALVWSFGRAAFIVFCVASLITGIAIEWSPRSKRLAEILRNDSAGRGGLGV
jgi:hypothetical protein